MRLNIFGDLPRDQYYYLSYGPMVDGYRHAWRDENGRIRVSRGKPPHPPDPRCPGCVEDRGPCPECGRSTHPSLSPCEHNPGRINR